MPTFYGTALKNANGNKNLPILWALKWNSKTLYYVHYHDRMNEYYRLNAKQLCTPENIVPFSGSIQTFAAQISKWVIGSLFYKVVLVMAECDVKTIKSHIRVFTELYWSYTCL